MSKRVSALMLALCLLLSVNALAVVPMADSTTKCTPYFSVNGNTAICSLRVNAQDSSASITAAVTLLKSDGEGGYTVLHRWTGLRGTGTLEFSDSYTSGKITGGAAYRMEYSVRVVGKNGTDNVSSFLQIS